MENNMGHIHQLFKFDLYYPYTKHLDGIDDDLAIVPDPSKGSYLKLGCGICGEIRHLWDNGKIDILKGGDKHE